VPLNELVLGEGWDFALVPVAAIRQGSYYSAKAGEIRPLGAIHQKILLDFHNGKGDTMTVERWTDEMLDELASSVDSLRLTAQALLKVAAQNQQKMDQFEEEIELVKQRQLENDQRFNVLLEEVRYLIRGNQQE
jgi:hypothetical protein